MKPIPTLLAISLLLAPGAVMACGTRAPAVQSKIDAAELASLRVLASAAARDADQIFIGTVTSLTRPEAQPGKVGSVTFRVDEALKEASDPILTVSWKEHFTYSCSASDGFHNVGFRPGGKFIVYIRDGHVFRSAAADHLRSGLLSLVEERATAAHAGGS